MTLKGFISRGERGFELVEDSARPAPAAVSAPAPRTVSPSTSIDSHSELEGRLRCKQTLRIDGVVRGQIECEKTVIVGECARVRAQIDADEVQIAGLVEGDIVARRKITLERTAVVTGDLTTPGIVIEEGAKLKGRIVIGSDSEEVENESAKAKKVQPLKPAAAKPVDAPVAAAPVATPA